jgi:hypothetical protein
MGVTGPAGPSTGAAGGDLTGSHPDPRIAQGAVTTNSLADGAVTNAKLANPSLMITAGTGLTGGGTVGLGGSGTLSVDPTVVQTRLSQGCSAGSAMTSIAQNGTPSCQPFGSGDGTITGVSAGTGLTGGGNSGNVDLSVANQGISTGQIADGAVTGAQVAGGSLTLADLAVWRFNNTFSAGSLAGNACLGATVSGTGVPVSPGEVLLGWIDDTATLTFAPNIVTTAHQAQIEFCNPTSNQISFPTLNYTVIAVKLS